jgi:hypothetical protein
MIILLGFPKSGTTSFHKLFKNLDYESYHWKFGDKYIGDIIKWNKRKGKKLLSFIDESKYDNTCITQMDVCISWRSNYWPQLVDFEQLYNENKEAIFILNKRNPCNLLKSFKKWNKYDKRIQYFNKELFNPDQDLIGLFTEHYEKVEHFFKNLKNDVKFVSFDIENDNLEKLSKYIDLKEYTVLPHENKN